jgi:hypothetical protein
MSPKQTNHKSWESGEPKKYRILEWTALGVAIIVAGINYFQWRDANSNFVKDERAWLSADKFGIATNTYGIGKRFVYVAQLTNTGKSPAFIDGIEYQILSSNIASTNMVEIFATNIQGGVVAPGAANPILMYEPFALSDIDFEMFDTKHIVRHVWAVIRYHDGFVTNRTTKCFVPFSGAPTGDNSTFVPDKPPYMD